MSIDIIILCAIVVFVLIFLAFYTGRKTGGKKSSYESPKQKKGNSSKKEKVASQKDKQHPVLEYQRKASYDTHPANYGDPVRPLGIAAAPTPSTLGYKNNPQGRAYAYDVGDGPYVGKPLNVPVPQGSLKMSSEKYGYPFYYQRKPLNPYDYFKPYGPNQESMQSEIVYADDPFYKRNNSPYAVDYTGSSPIPFISSVNAFAPFPEVQTAWEKTGIIQTVNSKDTTIMNLYRKPIAPLQDLFEYSVQDKNGFIVPLKVNYLEDGDIIKHVPGREALGSWKANIYINNKWVWA